MNLILYFEGKHLHSRSISSALVHLLLRCVVIGLNWRKLMIDWFDLDESRSRCWFELWQRGEVPILIASTKLTMMKSSQMITLFSPQSSSAGVGLRRQCVQPRNEGQISVCECSSRLVMIMRDGEAHKLSLVDGPRLKMRSCRKCKASKHNTAKELVKTKIWWRCACGARVERKKADLWQICQLYR